MPGIPDPGRAPLDQHDALLDELADYLDQPVRVREQRTARRCPSTCGTAPYAPRRATGT